jgi:hypothetical protein
VQTVADRGLVGLESERWAGSPAILDFSPPATDWILDWRDLWQSARDCEPHRQHGSAVRGGGLRMAGPRAAASGKRSRGTRKRSQSGRWLVANAKRYREWVLDEILKRTCA